MRVESEHPSILLGANQQPEFQRPLGALLDAKNLFLSLADGAARRPGTEHIARLTHPDGVSIDVAGLPLQYLVERSADVRFQMEFAHRTGLVYDAVTGERHPVYNQAGTIETDFDYLKAYATQAIPLRTPEGLTDNDGSAPIDPATGPSAPDASWKLYRTKPGATFSYANATAGASVRSPGPEMGKVEFQTLSLVKSGAGADEDGYAYYKFFAANGENIAFNKFAPAGLWTVFAIYFRQSLANPTPNFEIGFANLDLGATPNYTMHRAKFLLSSLGGNATQYPPDSMTGSVRARVEKMRNGDFRAIVAHRSNATEAGNSMVPIIYFDAPASDAQVTRELLVMGATLEWSKTPDAGPFWEKPSKAFVPFGILDTNLIANRTKTVAMSSAKVGRARMVEFVTAVPADDASITITRRGVARKFVFDSTSVPADAPTATPPTYYINTTGFALADVAPAFATKVNSAFGAGIARATTTKLGVKRLVHLHGVQDLAEAGDGAGRINFHELYEAQLWVKGSGPGAQFLTRIKQSAGFIKVAAIAAYNATSSGNNVQMNQCVGYTVPGGFSGASNATIQAACELTSAAQDFDKGVFFPAAAGGGWNQAFACQDDSTETVAIEMAFRDISGGTAAEWQKGIWPKWAVAPFSVLNTVEVVGNVIHLASPDPFIDVHAHDSFGGESFVLIRDDVPRKTDLPTVGVDGMVIRVKGDNERSIDDYWARFNAKNDGTFGPGEWEEEAAYDANIALDPLTMPHQMVFKVDDAVGTRTTVPGKIYFEWGPLKYTEPGTGASAGWDERHAGDATHGPDPSIVGRAIRDIFLHQLRLGMVAGQQLVLSEINRLYNLFRNTVVTVDPKDRIDTSLPSRNAYELAWAEPLGKALLLGDTVQVQAIPPSPNGLSFDTIERDVLLRIRMNEFVRPVAYEQSLFVAFTRTEGDFSGVWEVFPSPEGEIAAAEDATLPLPAFLEGQIEQMAFCLEEGILAVRTSANRNKIYISHIQKTGGRRVVQNWIPQDFGEGAKVTGIGFYGADLHCTVERQYGFNTEKIRFRSRAADKGSHYLAHMDRRTGDSSRDFTKLFSGGLTLLRLPYRLDDLDAATTSRIIVAKQFTGEEVPIQLVTTIGSVTQINLHASAGDLSSPQDALWVGIDYESSGVCQPPHIADNKEGKENSGGVQRALEYVCMFEDTGAIDFYSSSRGARPKKSGFRAGTGNGIIPREGAPTRFIFTGVPNNLAMIGIQPPDSDPMAIQMNAGPGVDTEVAFFVDVTANNTLPLFLQAFARKLFQIFGLPVRTHLETSRGIVYLDRSGSAIFSVVNDPGGEMTIEVGLALERGRFPIPLVGEVSEQRFKFQSYRHHPFRIAKFDFVDDIAQNHGAQMVG